MLKNYIKSDNYTSFVAAIECSVGDENSFFASKSNHENQLIGVFDSGVGGLSVLQHLMQQLPRQRFIYLADTMHVPYGTKTASQIESYTLAAVTWLYLQGCKVVVIACNSASANILPKLRRLFGNDLKIVGLVPALKPAIEYTKTKKVAVLATQATLNGQLLSNVIKEFAEPKQVQVFKYFEPSLVPWVESGLQVNHFAYDKLQIILKEMVSLNIDSVVLGCTHYPFFRHVITSDMGLKSFDSGLAIAKRVESLLKQNDEKLQKTHLIQKIIDFSEKNVKNCVNLVSECIFFTTNGTIKQQKLIENLLFGIKQ